MGIRVGGEEVDRKRAKFNILISSPRQMSQTLSSGQDAKSQALNICMGHRFSLTE